MDPEDVVFRIANSNYSRPPTVAPVEGKYLVTGATGAFGTAICKHLAALRGIEIVAVGRRRSRLQTLRSVILQDSGNSIETLAIDWGRVGADNVAKKRFGHLAGIIHCAGSYGEIGALSNVKLRRWIRAVDNQLVGAVNAVKLASFWSRDHHVAVVLLSGGGASKAYIGLSAYSVIKTSLVRVVEAAALENHVSAFSINALGPGAAKSAMVDAVLRNADNVDPRVLEVSKALEAQKGPSGMGRFLSATTWLLSDQGRTCSGKFLSAQWDNWDDIASNAGGGADDYTLRRVFS